MLGLRTQESDKFNKFWSMVQNKAKEHGKIFFGDCGEGNDFETEEMEGEDFCGWLIPEDKAEEFKIDWEKQDVSDDWSENIAWVEWKNKNGKIVIEFNKYD